MINSFKLKSIIKYTEKDILSYFFFKPSNQIKKKYQNK